MSTMAGESVTYEQIPGVQALNTILPKQKKLKVLTLKNLNIDNLTFLGGLKLLEKLDIRGNPIRNLFPISKLKQLKELRLDISEHFNFSFLGKLENLMVLDLGANPSQKLQNSQHEQDSIKKSLSKLSAYQLNLTLAGILPILDKSPTGSKTNPKTPITRETKETDLVFLDLVSIIENVESLPPIPSDNESKRRQKHIRGLILRIRMHLEGNTYKKTPPKIGWLLGNLKVQKTLSSSRQTLESDLPKEIKCQKEYLQRKIERLGQQKVLHLKQIEEVEKLKASMPRCKIIYASSESDSSADFRG